MANIFHRKTNAVAWYIFFTNVPHLCRRLVASRPHQLYRAGALGAARASHARLHAARRAKFKAWLQRADRYRWSRLRDPPVTACQAEQQMAPPSTSVWRLRRVSDWLRQPIARVRWWYFACLKTLIVNCDSVILSRVYGFWIDKSNSGRCWERYELGELVSGCCVVRAISVSHHTLQIKKLGWDI